MRAAPSPRPPRTTGAARTGPVLARYVLLQLPGLAAFAAAAAAAHFWLALPAELAIGAVVVWIAKDALLFPFVRKAYEPGSGRAPRDLLDAVGVAHEGLEQEGWVRVGPELWRARLAPGSPPLAPGESVRVVAIEGLTVTVEPIPSERSEGEGQRGPDDRRRP